MLDFSGGGRPGLRILRSTNISAVLLTRSVVAVLDTHLQARAITEDDDTHRLHTIAFEVPRIQHGSRAPGLAAPALGVMAWSHSFLIFSLNSKKSMSELG